MKAPSEAHFLPAALAVLEDLHRGDGDFAKARKLVARRHRATADAEVTLGTGDTLLLEYKPTDRIASVAGALELREALELPAAAGPTFVLVVPYMGPKARELATERGLDWLDLSGNADVWTGTTRLLSRGYKNRYPSIGRPRSAFAPKAARITRVLLVDHPRRWTQRELAQATDLSEGHVSRTVMRLEEADLVTKVGGHIAVADPVLLLKAWEQDYQGPHEVVRAHVGARTNEAVLEIASAALQEAGIQHAATGLAGAWSLRPVARHRLVSLLVERLPTAREAQGIELGVKGGNVELLVPRDSGVFYGAQDGVASPVQVYMDLARGPERSDEAQAELLQLLHKKWAR
jgi:hypothetical protein